MIIDITQILLQHNTLGSQLTMESGINGGVEGDILIGHDATAAINGAMLAQRLVFQRVNEVNTIGIGEFTTLQTIDDIHRIILVVALGIGLLNAASRGGEIMCDGEAYHRTVGQVERTLNKALTEGTATNDHSTILILDGTSHDFCR